MRIVVTGASGFIGRHLIQRLADLDAHVIAVSRSAFVAPDTVDRVQVRDYAETPAGDVLIHLAEESRIAAIALAPKEASADNGAVLQALIGKGFEHVVYASSAAVYGDEHEYARRVTEDLAPVSAYARAKLICEDLVRRTAGAVVRIANTYGSYGPQETIMSDLLAQAYTEGPMRLRDPAPIRDFIHVIDVADGLAQIVTQEFRGIINLGTGVGTSAGALAALVNTAAGRDGRAVEFNGRSARASCLVLDMGATYAAIGWRPKIDLATGLAHILSDKK
jgi:nucleoside-diphosphate-sugar epimerase